MIVGDFNFHIDDKNDREAIRFLDLINAFNLQQHVQEATHRLGHTLDLVITRAADDFVKDLFTTQYLPSDHAAVAGFLSIRKPKAQRMNISTRKIKEIDMDSFRNDITSSELYTSPASNVGALVDRPLGSGGAGGAAAPPEIVEHPLQIVFVMLLYINNDDKLCCFLRGMFIIFVQCFKFLS